VQLSLAVSGAPEKKLLSATRGWSIVITTLKVVILESGFLKMV
jgi:hypothetical protein